GGPALRAGRRSGAQQRDRDEAGRARRGHQSTVTSIGFDATPSGLNGPPGLRTTTLNVRRFVTRVRPIRTTSSSALLTLASTGRPTGFPSAAKSRTTAPSAKYWPVSLSR